nr:alpha/beta fold hydrolase [Sporosarcina sp. 6E9]
MVIQIVGSFFIYGLAIERGPKEYLEDNADLEVSDETMDLYINGSWIDWVADQPFQKVTIPSRDGLQLIGYFLPASQPTNKVVVLTHGYLGEAWQMGLFGQYYNELGYDIFMPDARGHGLSEGDYYGFGGPDRFDVIDWTRFLVEELGKNTEVIYHGLSMGAATVLMTSGEADLPKQVKAIIADSPYESVYELFKYQLKKMFYMPAFPLLDGASLLMKMKTGYSFKKADALKEVEKTKVPILYIHGESDTFVPTEMSKDLYQHTASEKELLLIPNANHGESFALAEDEYKMKVNHFLDRYLN